MEVTGFLCPLMSGNTWYTPRCQLKQSCFAFKYILFHRQVSGKIVRVGHFLWVGDRGRALGVSSGGRSGRSSYSDRHSRTQSCLLWMVRRKNDAMWQSALTIQCTAQAATRNARHGRNHTSTVHLSHQRASLLVTARQLLQQMAARQRDCASSKRHTRSASSSGR